MSSIFGVRIIIIIIIMQKIKKKKKRKGEKKEEEKKTKGIRRGMQIMRISLNEGGPYVK